MHLVHPLVPAPGPDDIGSLQTATRFYACVPDNTLRVLRSYAEKEIGRAKPYEYPETPRQHAGYGQPAGLAWVTRYDPLGPYA